VKFAAQRDAVQDDAPGGREPLITVAARATAQAHGGAISAAGESARRGNQGWSLSTIIVRWVARDFATASWS